MHIVWLEQKKRFKAPYWRTEIFLVKQCFFNTRAPILYLYTYYTYCIYQVPVCHLIMSDVLCVVHTSTIVLCGGEIVESLGVLTVTQNPTSWQSCPIPGGGGDVACALFSFGENLVIETGSILAPGRWNTIAVVLMIVLGKNDGVEKMMMILNPSCDLRDMIPWSWLDLDLVHQLS